MIRIFKIINFSRLATIILIGASFLLASFGLQEKLVQAADYTPKNVRVCELTSTTAKICWETTDKSNSELVYVEASKTLNPSKSPPDKKGSSFELLEHSLVATGLKANTEYKYVVRSSPNAQTTSTVSPELTFTTKKADGTGGTVIQTTPGNTAPAKLVTPGKIKDPFGGKSLLSVGTKFINLLLALIVIAAVVVIIIAGFRMVVGGGNPAQISKAKKAILYSILGLAVALMSFAIVEIIQRFLEK